MTTFADSFKKTLGAEGGYSNRANDKGGETYRGISRRYHPGWEGWALVDAARGPLDENAALQEAVERFYRQEFWNPLHAEAFAQFIADALFDAAVNCGIKRAVTWFQRGVNCLNNNQRYFPNITVDGSMGPKTLDAYDRVRTQDLAALHTIMRGLRVAFYVSRMEEEEDQEENVGWFSRV